MPEPDILGFLEGRPSAAPRPSGGGREPDILGAITGKPTETEAPDVGPLRRYGAMGLRGIGALAPPGPIGFGVNAALELGAQTIEGREEYNWPTVAAQGTLGAIPFGKAGNLGRTLLKGAGLGAGSTALLQQTEEGLHVPTAEDIGMIGLGGVMGTGGAAVGAGIGRALRGRNVPAVVEPGPVEPAARPVRGLLPPARIYVDDRGAARVGDLPVIDLNAEPPRVEAPAPRAAKGPRLKSPAVTEWDIDPTVDAKEGVRPRVYSSDVGATDAGFVTADERKALELYRQELEEFPADMGAQIRDPNDPSSSIYAAGTPASRAHHAITKTSRAHESNTQMIEAIDSLLAGERPTNRIQTAALDLARSYVEKRPGHIPPMFAGLEDADPIMRRVLAEEAERADDPGWAMFSDAVDEIGARTRPSELVGAGERGFATLPAMVHTAGGLGGAAYGAATGEDAEDRFGRAAAFGALGLGGAAALTHAGRRLGGAAAREGERLNAGKVADAGELNPADVAVVGRQPRVPRTRAMGEPIPDPMAETDRFLGKFHPEIRQGIEQRLEANDGYQTQRRGVRSVDSIGKTAEQIRVNLTEALPKGSAVSGEVITAYARAAAATQKKVAEAAAHVAAGNNSDLDLLRLEHARADADVVLKSLMGMRAEAGRSLATFRYLDRLLATGDTNMVRDTADQLRRSAQEFALKFKAEGGETPIDQYKWLQSQVPSSNWEKLRTYMYANMLSGPKTHERNIIGNVSNLIGRTASTPVAAGIDILKSIKSGKAREVFAGEVGAGLKQVARKLRDESVNDFWFTLKEGVNPAALKRSTEAATRGVLDVPRVEFKGGWKNPFNLPGRALDATDVFFRSVGRNMEIGQGAYAMARKEGKTGEALTRRMAELRSGAGEEGAKLLETAEKNAARSVFQEDPGAAVKWAAQGYRLKGWGALQTVMMPFLKTPANILRQGLEASPAGFGMKAAQQGGREGTRAQGIAAMGSGAAAILAYLAATDRLSGMGPTDPQERATLMETGWRPNSVKIGDKWVNYQAIAPIGVQASIIANLMEAHKGRKLDKGYVDSVMETMGRFGNSFLDQSFLSGMSELLEAIKDPERSMARWGSRTAQTMIPFVGAVRSARDLADPTIRSPKTFGEEVKASIPGVSRSIEPRLSTTGEEVKREGGPLRRALDPFNTAAVVDDPTAKEMKRLGIEATRLGTKLTLPPGYEISRQQLHQLRQEQGRLERKQIERLIKDQRYQRASDAVKIKAIETIQRQARQAVNDRAKVRIVREARRRK